MNNQDKNNAAFYYSVNMPRLLRGLMLITEEEYRRIAKICAAHYGTKKIYI